MLESGEHEVAYGVCCDDDDPQTSLLCAGLQGEIPLAFRVGPRPESLGGVINDMAERMPADAYLALTDHCLCLTPNWDEKIAAAVAQTPHGVFWWKNALPHEALLAIVTEGWRKAAGGIFTDHYPFWFDDLCLLEQWVMATDAEPLVLDVTLAHKATSTHRMRDLPFWQDFFIRTRALRVEKGKEIAAALGLPTPAIGFALAERLTAILKSVPPSELHKIEQGQGDASPPDPAYLAAKARAESILTRIKE